MSEVLKLAVYDNNYSYIKMFLLKEMVIRLHFDEN
jgi:hypothetical protein